MQALASIGNHREKIIKLAEFLSDSIKQIFKFYAILTVWIFDKKSGA